jgi:hypothetical protein
MGALGPDEVMDLLRQRLVALDAEIAATGASLAKWSAVLPRMFLVEVEYELALRGAEAAWVRSLLDEMETGTLPGVAAWREYHETGRAPEEFAQIEERVRHARESELGEGEPTT